ncbi:MAG: hypothetical protein SNJ70_09610, partial [Armatimonadota bacterium]
MQNLKEMKLQEFLKKYKCNRIYITIFCIFTLLFAIIIPLNALTIDKFIENVGKTVSTGGDGVPILVFNPLSVPRTDIVIVESPFKSQASAITVIDQHSRVYQGQHWGEMLMFTARNVPPMGFKMFWAKERALSSKDFVSSDITTLENEFYRTRIAPNIGAVSSMYDIKRKRHIINSGDLSSVISLVFGDGSSKEILNDSEVVTMDSGPVRGRIVFDHQY